MTLTQFPDDWQTALCVAAHPDDLEYGTAAVVAGWTAAGKDVSYLLVTRGEAGIDGMPPEEAAPARAQEERDGAAEVGVDRVDFLDEFTDGTVEYGLPLRRAIAAQIRRVKPELVVVGSFEMFYPGGFVNQADHRAVGMATVDACADAGNRWIFPELIGEGLEPWGGCRYVAIAASTQPTHFVDVTETFDEGVASLEAHQLYNKGLGPDFPSPRELLTQILGMEHLRDYGEKVWAAQLINRR
ncbi:PIG-L deacetylase family protein [Ornithinimicrobium cryptoxanthini]|uniref:PIG-L deacetylase family protein n=1 Tax=Ornithinimicrobium cryptoxanthini TaxID=2934161 RepID=UPI002117B637|nr:PIG-L deacetylase family protein [Ornithinimicrobium cryptoxanthini]